MLVLAIGVFITLAVVIVMVFWAIKMVNDSKRPPISEVERPVPDSPAPEPEPAEPSLPSSGDDGRNGGNGNGQIGWEAQNVSFGDFYKVDREDLRLVLPDYPLPQNVKVDVANYYDFSRKINLDAALGSLNENGFASIDNPFPSEAKNFYQAYSVLKSKQVPVMLTSDFLIYYYQNTLKKAFKDIEGTVFYDNLWQTNKRLYAIAKDRYEANLNKTGLANDLALEGARRELAFFATALSI